RAVFHAPHAGGLPTESGTVSVWPPRRVGRGPRAPASRRPRLARGVCAPITPALTAACRVAQPCPALFFGAASAVTCSNSNDGRGRRGRWIARQRQQSRRPSRAPSAAAACCRLPPGTKARRGCCGALLALPVLQSRAATAASSCAWRSIASGARWLLAHIVHIDNRLSARPRWEDGACRGRALVQCERPWKGWRGALKLEQ